MICILSGNKLEATRWAEGQLLEQDEWFYPESESDLLFRKNFHVIVVGTAGQNVHPVYFERILKLAKTRGRMK
jgi:hypothetical protein